MYLQFYALNSMNIILEADFARIFLLFGDLENTKKLSLRRAKMQYVHCT